MSVYNLLSRKKEQDVIDAIILARRIQDYLWGPNRGEAGLEGWIGYLEKRIDKLKAVDLTNPNAIVEIRKRVLQTAALSTALLEILDDMPDDFLEKRK